MRRHLLDKNSAPCPFLCCNEKSELYGWIEVTGVCNLRCPYCYADSSAKAKQALPLVKIKELLKDFYDLGARVVMISGGEPTVRSDLAEILEYGSRLGLKLNLVTNGSFLNETIVKILAKYKIPVQLSIDSVDREAYIKSRGVDLLPVILKNVELLLKNKVEVYLAATLTRMSQKYIQQLIEFAVEKGIQNVHIGELIPEGRSKVNKDIFIESVYPAYKELYELQKKYFLFVSIDLIEYFINPIVFEEKRVFHCNAMRGKTLEIGYDGEVYYCGGIRDYDKASPPLNVYKDNLKAIYQSMQKTQFCMPVTDINECRSCEYAFVCSGGCRAIAYHHNGNIGGKNPYCKDIKRLIRDIYKDLSSGNLDEYVDFLKNQDFRDDYLIQKMF